MRCIFIMQYIELGF